MSNDFKPYDWYWLKDATHIYGSARQTIVTNTDADYQTWTGLGNVATPWPKDAGGNQTDQALQDVLTPYGLFANLTFYSADARWRRRNAGITITSLSPGIFMTDEPSINDINSSYNYGQANPAATFKWKMADGSFTNLNATSITTLHNDALNFVQACFAEESTLASGISGGSITTRAQVDAGYAAVSNVYP